jgi:uncharacterized membrane protein YgdD (TMEM256/DUF423 family)
LVSLLVSQARSSWQQALNIYRLLIEDKQFRRLSGQALCLGVFALLWWMNWKLFLTTSVGIGAMSACYLAQNPHWQNYYRQWQKFLVGSNRQLTLAVGTGASGAFCTYLAASIWADTDNQWLATGTILQGFVSLTTLICLLWSLRGKKASSLEAKLDQLLIDLSDRDRLKRLVAIRQLTRLLINHRMSAEHYQQSIEYYRLMLSEPQPAVIKDALLESLELLGATKISEPCSPIKIPLQFKYSPKPVLDNRS